MAQVESTGLRKLHPLFFFFWCCFFGGCGGVLINCWFKQRDCWQRTPPLNLTALIKLTVAIKHIPQKYVSNDTWSTAGHLCRKLYSKILLKPTTIQDQVVGGWLGLKTLQQKSWILAMCYFLYFIKMKVNSPKRATKSKFYCIRETFFSPKKSFLLMPSISQISHLQEDWFRPPLHYTWGCHFCYSHPCGHFDTSIDTCVFHSAFLKIAGVVNCIHRLPRQSETAITQGRSLNMFQETQEELGNWKIICTALQCGVNDPMLWWEEKKILSVAPRLGWFIQSPGLEEHMFKQKLFLNLC